MWSGAQRTRAEATEWLRSLPRCSSAETKITATIERTESLFVVLDTPSHIVSVFRFASGRHSQYVHQLFWGHPRASQSRAELLAASPADFAGRLMNLRKVHGPGSKPSGSNSRKRQVCA